ncbi:hypothetical protein IVA79_07290 [Bradyrhizobium sp. 138]|uniref:DUF5680 domain-containing protein n=1 Tax=Bradyrhizobium sp. 138 TaxID=2782615 RepID=UPI001FF71C54|nr:DUF5680 domain-containing protein [Bradyrhizobium sp. 138]MCK1733769.1 hypothetical protein [Bradyrhizobium sp. 138]
MSSIPHDLAAFLVEAKRRTYAGLDDDATVAAPSLAGSKQLEHRAPPYAYRDIYFGMGFFVGTVSRDERLIWSMSYSGGVRAEIGDRETLLAIYKFLRQALLGVRVEQPYRGRPLFEQAGMVYRNEIEGALDRFHGVETIARQDGVPLYELRYSGGLLR